MTALDDEITTVFHGFYFGISRIGYHCCPVNTCFMSLLSG